MNLSRGIFFLIVCAIGAALPWIVRDTLHQPSDRTLTHSVTEAGTFLKTKTTSSARSELAAARAITQLNDALKEAKAELGNPIFIRLFKEEKELEVWIQPQSDSPFQLLKTYPICRWSGKLGPKLKEGDRQSPEGFYFVPPSRMNPNSRYHLSFDIGFPNAYDRSHGRTGSYLMIHGECVSIGCYAMTNPYIEEIYTLANAAHLGGQAYFRVHAFPFRMTDKKMATLTPEKTKWFDFWANLKEGYDFFEIIRQPPNVKVADKKYVFSH